MRRILRWFSILCIWALFLYIILESFETIKVQKISPEEPEKTFKRLDISLNSTNLEEINSGQKNTIYPGNEIKISDGNQSFTYKNVDLKGRGNSTWAAEKKPYQLKFTQKTELFDMTGSKTWILLANSFDDTYLRNYIADELINQLDSDFYREGNFVELFINEDYIGLYYLTKKITTKNLKLKNEKGIIAEIDNSHRNEWDKILESASGDHFVLSDSVEKDEEKVNEYFKEFIKNFNELERAIAEKNYKKIEKIADLESFAKYFLISEFSSNLDAYSTSFYFYKDGDDDKIHAGPAWDFDLAFNNDLWWVELKSVLSPTNFMPRKAENDDNVSDIIYDLMEIPEFKTLVKNLYFEKFSDKKGEIFIKIDKKAEEISSAAEKDEKKWKENKINFKKSVLELINWINLRYEFLDEFFAQN